MDVCTGCGGSDDGDKARGAATCDTSERPVFVPMSLPLSIVPRGPHLETLPLCPSLSPAYQASSQCSLITPHGTPAIEKTPLKLHRIRRAIHA